MEKEQARQEVRARWRELYPASKDGKGIICPLCGHGVSGDGIVINKKSDDPLALKCFGGGCGFAGDAISLIEKAEGKDYFGALEWGAARLGFSVEGLHRKGDGDYSRTQRDTPHTARKLYEQGQQRTSVYIVESAMNAEDLSRLYDGFCYTVSGHAGRGRWLPEFTERLRAVGVKGAVILRDNDNQGRAFAEEAAAALSAIAERVKILDLRKVWPEIPEHGSVSDLIAAFGNDKAAELLDTLESDTPQWKPPEPDRPSDQRQNAQQADYTAYYRECQARLADPAAVSYLQARGISLETAQAAGVGYDPAWVSPTALKRLRERGKEWTPPPTPRIIIPCNPGQYEAREPGTRRSTRS